MLAVDDFVSVNQDFPPARHPEPAPARQLSVGAPA